MLFNKKAAMFGLDARIALAIFGALSVISGAALYSAIQNAKITKLITELDNVGKAYEQYFLDTGSELDIYSADRYLEIGELVASSKNGWKGPYLNQVVLGPNALKHPEYNTIIIVALTHHDWAAADQASWTTADCVNNSTGNDCYAWVGFSTIGVDLRQQIDEKIDGSYDGSTGNVRHFHEGGTDAYYIFIKYMPFNNF